MFALARYNSDTALHDSQSGQIGVIILLVMVVLLTIGLSVAARTSKEVSLSTQEEESTRVFTAAETGLEQALAQDLANLPNTYTESQSLPANNANLDYTIKKMNILETHLFEGSSAVVNVLNSGSSAPDVDTLKINWGKNTSCSANPQPASLIIAIYSIDQAVVPARTAVRYQAISPCNAKSDSIPVSTTAGTGEFFRSVNVAIQSNDRLVRIKPIYNDTDIKVTGSKAGTDTALPVQYYNIRSTATNTRGNETRIVEVNRTLPVAPGILDFVLFSGTSLSK
jgi:flagellar basal body-associated protein FliL